MKKRLRPYRGLAKMNKSEIKATALSRESAVSSRALGDSVRRLGFMGGQIFVPDDFDRMGSEEIERIFSVGKKNNK